MRTKLFSTGPFGCGGAIGTGTTAGGGGVCFAYGPLWKPGCRGSPSFPFCGGSCCCDGGCCCGPGPFGWCGGGGWAGQVGSNKPGKNCETGKAPCAEEGGERKKE